MKKTTKKAAAKKTTAKRASSAKKETAPEPQVTPQPQVQPGVQGAAEVGPTNTNAMREASKVAVGTDVAGTPAEAQQAALVGGPDAPGANVDDYNTDAHGGVTINDAAEGDKPGRDDNNDPIVKDRNPLLTQEPHSLPSESE